MKFDFEITEDGSHTLYVPALDEHYHSTHGALQEARHVYIDAALHRCQKPHVRILEVGFGTGLNAFLTLLETEKRQQTAHYTSLELYPLSLQDARKLNFASLIAPDRNDHFLQLHALPWDRAQAITPAFVLEKRQWDFSKPDSFCFDGLFDVVYFDAFAPDKQPGVWTQALFDKIYEACAGGAVITTYCAKGSVRRMLQAAGFAVERLPGPPGKREMLRGWRREQGDLRDP
ncbi:tRNA (5-methylaminomethyl-2-thiouridine)(34)-methyltransferase MnmD [Limibacterium fermenti]|uniref:tRNA (5-methylaminomethyl-2-thiouridine)(34)-methyltransferase MnmD n=1 Tax=Limibacterium fermenti TaxID=3229863 RepID=UPI003A5EF093